MIRSWARRVLQEIIEDKWDLGGVGSSRTQRKDRCVCSNRDPSQSVTESGWFFTMSTLFLEGQRAHLCYSFSRSPRGRNGCKEIKRKSKPRHASTWTARGVWLEFTAVGLRTIGPAGSDAFLDLTGLKTWRLAEPVAEMGISVPFVTSQRTWFQNHTFVYVRM